MRSRYLVTGGAGFIGSHLCDEIIRHEDQVYCVDNLVTGVKQNIEHLIGHPSFEFIEDDVTGATNLKVDGIFHLASPTAPEDSNKYGEMTVDVNSKGTEALLKMEKPLLFTSSMKVYDFCPRMVAYIEGKRLGEVLCEKHFAKIARLASVYGPRMRNGDSRVIPNFINKAFKNEPLSAWNGGEQFDSFCYVSDIVKGLYTFMTMVSKRGVFEFGNPRGIKIIDLAKMIIGLTGSKSKIITTERQIVTNGCHLMPNIMGARSILGWKPTINLKDGLLFTILSRTKDLENAS